MWEFSLNFKSENFEIAKFVHTNLKQMADFLFVTTSETSGNICVLVATNDDNKDRAQMLIRGIVTEIVCTKFKSDYLDNNLALPLQDTAGVFAFKRALLNFDRETDKYLVGRALVLANSLYMESFFAFKLRALQEKWEELVRLSNENREYLVSKESFIDLLKFLVDNLDICATEIDIIKEDAGYRIINSENAFYENRLISEERVVSSVIDLSPQKINLYFQEGSYAINLLQRIFDERITINNEKNNIKTFKVNENA